MDNESEKPKCDIDDIICQIKILDSLRVIKDSINEEGFKERFPELVNLGNTLASKISEQDSILRNAFEKCGLAGIEREPEEITVEEE